ncbi:MAG: GAF domain-containing protein [Myxococcota bacterium]
MGTFGQRCFEEANKLGGLVAKMRLASIAQITSTEAATLNDSPELMAKLEAALGRIRGEFATVPNPKPSPASPPVATPEAPKAAPATSDLPRRCMTTVADLIAQRSLFAGDLDATVRRITEAAASTLDIERVSVWFLNAERSKIVCADLFERAAAQHSSGVELMAGDFAPYFEALAGERTIAAHDANSDPRTRCFSEVYLKPLNIGALLDVPIWASGTMVGVICHEHIGPSRRWSTDEETFAYVMSSLVALTLEQRVLVHPSLAPPREA